VLENCARDVKTEYVFDQSELHFEAESPDEVALLDAALAYGYVFAYTDIFNKQIRLGGA
jgi:hypothetical protein